MTRFTNKIALPLLVAAAGGLLAACTDDAQLPSAPQPGARSAALDTLRVPARGSEARSTFVHMSDDSLWSQIAAGDGKAIVGLKAPGAARGVYRNHILLGRRGADSAVAALRAQPGVEILSQDTLLPIVALRLQDRATLARIRRFPFIDYVNPARMRGFTLADGTGCSEDPYTGPTMYSPTGDVLPVHYRTLGIDKAWNRSNGDRVNIGVVDTGIFETSQQVGPWGFTLGESTARWAAYYNTASFGSPYAACSHGTRMAGIAAAPRDGQGAAGVAWGANLVSVRHNDDVVVGAFGGDAQQGIRTAAEASHIIAMAWGTPDLYDHVSDEIRYWAYNPALPRLFVGAAGSQKTCATWADAYRGVLFPALMQEVMAVTAIDTNGALACDAHGGSEVDVAAYYAYPTAGRSTDVLTMRGSSSATALVAGAAASVWSYYGGGAADTRRRLEETAAHYPSRTTYIGYGAINLMKALGGMVNASLNGCTSDTNCKFRYSTASCVTRTFSAAPVGGDGPYSYQWTNGSTGSTTSMVLCSRPGAIERYSIGVTVYDSDRLGNTSYYKSASIEVLDPNNPCATCPQ